MPKDFKVTEKKKDWHESRDSQVMTSDPLNYNASSQIKYSKALKKIVRRMTKTVRREIEKFFRSPDMEMFRAEQIKSAQDASVASQAKILTNKLISKFTWLFNDRAPDLAEAMVNSQLKNSRVNLASTLKDLSGGLTIKTNFMTGDLSEVVKSIVAENVSLIKSIADVYLSNVQKSVLRSITFGQGLKDLIPQLSKFDGMSERHAKNVALDQTRKTYNSINKARMEKVGVKKFKWLHSGGGQKPRKDHIEMNGNIYSFDDLPVIVKSTGERGIPGQAINCRCRMAPVIEFDEDGDES